MADYIWKLEIFGKYEGINNQIYLFLDLLTGFIPNVEVETEAWFPFSLGKNSLFWRGELINVERWEVEDCPCEESEDQFRAADEFLKTVSLTSDDPSRSLSANNSSKSISSAQFRGDTSIQYSVSYERHFNKRKFWIVLRFKTETGQNFSFWRWNKYLKKYVNSANQRGLEGSRRGGDEDLLENILQKGLNE